MISPLIFPSFARNDRAKSHNDLLSSPECKDIMEFLGNHFTDADKRTLLKEDICTFPKLKQLVNSPQRCNELKLSENGRNTFNEVMTETKVESLEKKTKVKKSTHEAHLKDVDEIKKMQEALKPFLDNVQELQAELEKNVADERKEIDESTRKKVDDAIQKLASSNEEFKSLSSKSFRQDKKGYLEDFKNLVNLAVDNNKALNDMQKQEESVEVCSYSFIY
jgi:hypothetical protein